MRKRLNKEELICEKYRLLDYAWAHSQLGMYKEAIRDCQKLIMLDENDPQSYLELGIAYEKDGEVDKAVKYYRRGIKKFPGYSRCYVNLGFIFEKHKKRNNMAIVCYEKAAELDIGDEWALNNIGAILTKEGKWAEGLLLL
jgi:tetratricopeptide (TPR) repeat protein